MGIKFNKTLICIVGLVLVSLQGYSQSAFIINKKPTTVDDLYKDNQDKFYELEKQKYELIEKIAQQQYLDAYWGDLAKGKNKSPEAARSEYLQKNAKVQDADLKGAIAKFKDHPQLKELSEAERNRQISEYLKSVKTREAIEGIIQKALASKKLVIAYPKPSEPIYNLVISSLDPVKYGPRPTDIKPLGCAKEKCPITVVEYSEFQCPFCTKVLPTVSQLLTEYKGKVRWIVRDFPLGFHKRARPAAAAAHCAREQGKYWQMYEELFKNQRALADDDFKNYAKNIGLDMKTFATCVKKPAIMAAIEANFRSGEKLGVTGTPAFFINGRRLSGALPYSEFKRVFDEELAKNGRG